MAREPKFRGSFGLSAQPIAGVTLYQDRKPSEPSIDEMLEELDRSDIRAARKEELLARIKERIANLSGEKKAEKPISDNPKRYLVNPETGRIDVVDDGEYSYKEALLISSSIRAKGGHFDDAINLINAAKTLSEGTKPPEGEKKREFYVDDDGIIHRDPENGDLTLSEARAISQSRRPPADPPPSYYVDKDGKVQQVAPGQPVVVEKSGQPGPSYFVNEKGELQEVKPGQPIVIRVESKSDQPPSTPIQLTDKAGNPIVMDIGSLISWRKFEGEERRADEEQKDKRDMAGAVKTFLTKIGEAAARAAGGR